MERVTGRGPRPPRASLGGLLLDCAAEGDELARERVTWVAGENAAYLRVGARACGLGEPTPITLAGGVMRHPSSLLVDALAAALPGCELLRARREPAHGALLAALDEGGAEPGRARRLGPSGRSFRHGAPGMLAEVSSLAWLGRYAMRDDTLATFTR